MKNPFELIREIEFGNLDRSNQNFKDNVSSIENFTLWIVGFTVTTIGLIISSIEKLKILISFTNIQTVLVLLISSLFFGIFNRYCILRLQIISHSINNFIRISLSNFDFPVMNPEYIDNEISIEELIDKFKIDYDLDYSNYFREYEKLDLVNKAIVIEELKLRHLEIGQSLKQIYDDGLENVRNIYKEAYGLSDKNSRNIFYMEQKTISNKFKVWTYFVDLTFIFCNLLFFISILTFVISIF